jgi:hypothetical protein
MGLLWRASRALRDFSSRLVASLFGDQPAWLIVVLCAIAAQPLAFSLCRFTFRHLF